MNSRLVPTSVTLNDLERRNSLLLRYFTEFDCLCRPITSHSQRLKIDPLRPQNIVSQLHLAKTDARSSRTVSLRQLSFLLLLLLLLLKRED